MNLEGVHVEGVRELLVAYVDATTPVNNSGPNIISFTSSPRCGRAEALARTEQVLPVLDRLYPEWRRENTESSNFEFKQQRDAAQKLMARLDSRTMVQELLGSADQSPRISAAALHADVWSAAAAQWGVGHRHEAVLAAAKIVNSRLQAKVSRRDVSEVDLVRQAFSRDDAEPGKPRLRFSSIADEQTRESMRQGVMNFGAGCFAAIRNPVGHLPNDQIELSEQVALEQLAALSLLARWIDLADVVTA